MKDDSLSQPPQTPDPLAYWVYISSAAEPLRDEDLQALLEKSRANNKRLGLTGLLLYKDGNFIQMLEGPESAVRTMTDKIGRDVRHRSMVSLARAYQTQRLFPNAWMGFLGSESVIADHRVQIDALLEFSHCSPEDNDPVVGVHPARVLMQTFAHYM